MKFDYKKEIVVTSSGFYINKFSFGYDYFYKAFISDSNVYFEFLKKLKFLNCWIEKIEFEKEIIGIKYRKITEKNFFKYLKGTEYFLAGNKVSHIQREEIEKYLRNNGIFNYINIYKKYKNDK